MQGLYRIVCTVNGCTYVGSSVRVPFRLQQHRSALRLGKHDNPKLQRAWNKYGAGAFVFEPFVSALPGVDVLLLEQAALDELFAQGPCFNIGRVAGLTQLGLKRSDTTKARISMSRKGKSLPAASLATRRERMRGLPNPMQGRKHTPETKELIAQRLRQGYAAGRSPSTHGPSAEHRQKQSVRLRVTPIRKDRGTPLRGTKNGEIREWPTTIACAKDIGCDLSYPSQRAGSGRLVKGWLLEYIRTPLHPAA